MSEQVACPHCRTAIGNDGSLSGQVARCPACGGTFTMPPLSGNQAAGVYSASQATEPHAAVDFSIPTSGDDRRVQAVRTQSHQSRGLWMSASLMFLVVVFLAALLAGTVFLIRWLSPPLANSSTNEASGTVRRGHDAGQAARSATGPGRSGEPPSQGAPPLNPQTIAALEKLGAETSIGADGRVREVSLSDFQFNDADVAYLRDLPNLRFVILQDADVTDESLALVGKLQDLEALDLTYCGITNHGLRHLTSLDRLKYVNLRQTKVTDRALSYLKELPALEVLVMDETETYDENMAEITELPGLRNLSLNHTSVSDESLSHLARLPRLRQLSLQYTRMTAKGLAALARSKSLRRIDLRHTGITRNETAEIRAALPRLVVETGS